MDFEFDGNFDVRCYEGGRRESASAADCGPPGGSDARCFFFCFARSKLVVIRSPAVAQVSEAIRLERIVEQRVTEDRGANC